MPVIVPLWCWFVWLVVPVWRLGGRKVMPADLLAKLGSTSDTRATARRRLMRSTSVSPAHAGMNLTEIAHS